MDDSTYDDVIAEVFGETSVGVVRSNNEDRFVIADLNASCPTFSGVDSMRYMLGDFGVLMAVSDGMGGHAAGEIASTLVVGSLKQTLGKSVAGDVHAALERAVADTNARVWDAAQQPGFEGMGATVVAVLLHANTAHVACVGDSRVYLIRRGSITQVTKDQSYVELLVRSGVLTREQAEQSPYKNVLLQAMGTRPNVEVALGRIEMRDGDIYVLCSDGLTNKVSAEEIREAFAKYRNLESPVRYLIGLANSRGGEDNVTIAVGRVRGSSLEEPTLEILPDDREHGTE